MRWLWSRKTSNFPRSLPFARCQPAKAIMLHRDGKIR
jgi:hypothetical protein